MLPDGRIAVFPQAFIVEPIDLGNLAGLVVATENCDAMGVSNLECDKECHGFD